MKTKNVKKMVGISLLSAIIVVLQLIAAVFPIKIGPVSISLVLVPVVIGAAVYGPSAGAFLGGVFGLIATVFCINGMDAGGQMVFQASPALCILVVMSKGVLAGLASGLVYKLVKSKNAYLAVLLAAIVCPVVNTGVFLLGMGLFFMDILRAWAGGSNVAGYLLSGIVLLNFAPELIINILFSPASQRIIHVAGKKQ